MSVWVIAVKAAISKVMLPMMMIKLYATKASEKIAEAVYDLTGGDGLVDIEAGGDPRDRIAALHRVPP